MKIIYFIFLCILSGCVSPYKSETVYIKYLSLYEEGYLKISEFYGSENSFDIGENFQMVKNAELNASYIYFLSALKLAEAGDLAEARKSIDLALSRSNNNQDYIVLKICLLSLDNEEEKAKILYNSIKNDHYFDVFHKFLLKSFYYGFESLNANDIGGYGVDYAKILSDIGYSFRNKEE